MDRDELVGKLRGLSQEKFLKIVGMTKRLINDDSVSPDEFLKAVAEYYRAENEADEYALTK